MPETPELRGPACTILRLGSLAIKVAADPGARLPPLLSEPLGPAFWSQSDGPHDALIRVSTRPAPDPAGLGVRMQTSEGWLIGEASGRRYIQFAEKRSGRDSSVLVEASADGAVWEAYTDQGPPGPDTDRYFGPLLKLVAIETLARRNGIIVHASGTMVDGRAFVFSGPGGAGKSTLARLFAADGRGLTLNDDHVILRLSDDGVYACGSPWGNEGSPCCNREAKLAALFFIGHGERNQARELTERESFRQFLMKAFLPHWQPRLVDACLAVMGHMLTRVPLLDLKFTPTPDVVDYVLSLPELDGCGDGTRE